MNEISVREKLTKEMIDEFDALNNVAPGSDEQKIMVENICKMYKVQLDENAAELTNQINIEKDIKERREKKIDRILRYTFDGACFAAGMLFNWVWTKRGLEFEEKGTFSSGITRNIFRDFGRMKKK